MKVSVVVPTYNSQEFLEECLINLQVCKQVYPDMEVIIVDNFSSDRTLDIARDFTDKVYSWGPERTAQANYGVSKAEGDVIYLTGSDMLRDCYFVKEGVEKIKQGYDAIYMSVLTHPRVTHFWGKVKALERESYIGTEKESARFFKKSVWEELGGFDGKLIGLEEDFQHRLDARGFNAGRIASREYHLHEDDTLAKIFKKAFYYGKFHRGYLKKHKGNAVKKITYTNLKAFLKHPIFLGGFIIYKTVQYAGGTLGLLFGR